MAPPGGPPPPPPPPGGDAGRSAPPPKVAGRGALLSSIQKGTKLRKATTNDRSAPLVAGRPASEDAGSASAGGAKAAGGLGGLFAGGMPKLRSSKSGGAAPALEPPAKAVPPAIKQPSLREKLGAAKTLAVASGGGTVSGKEAASAASTVARVQLASNEAANKTLSGFAALRSKIGGALASQGSGERLSEDSVSAESRPQPTQSQPAPLQRSAASSGAARTERPSDAPRATRAPPAVPEKPRKSAPPVPPKKTSLPAASQPAKGAPQRDPEDGPWTFPSEDDMPAPRRSQRASAPTSASSHRARHEDVETRLVLALSAEEERLCDAMARQDFERCIELKARVSALQGLQKDLGRSAAPVDVERISQALSSL